MIRVLTLDEVSFLLELAELMKKHAASFSTTGTDGIEISVYQTNAKMDDLDKSTSIPILFNNIFDENDIHELCHEVRVDIERIMQEYTPEKYGSNVEMGI